ncbi:MAG: hypothetical protein ABEJ92_08040 [Halobacteriales archaeon]
MPSTPLDRRPTIDPGDLRPVARQAAVLAVLSLLVGLGTLLPGVDRTFPGTAVPLRAVVLALGTLAAVTVLARSARTVAGLVRTVLAGPDRLVADAGRAAGALVAFASVTAAYRGFAGVAVPWLVAAGAAWPDDAGFLALALVPLAIVGSAEPPTWWPRGWWSRWPAGPTGPGGGPRPDRRPRDPPSARGLASRPG